MKNILIILALTFTGFLAFGYSESAILEKQFRFNQASPNAMAVERLGTFVVKQKVHVAIASYDFAVQGGVIGTGNLINVETKKAATLPKNALIVDCVIDVQTPATTSASGTIALGTGQAGNDLKGALAAASYTGRVACVPVGTAATMIKLTADRTMTYTIDTGAITAGKFNVIVQYVLSN